MLYGCFKHSIDEKGRLSIPSKIRTELSNKLFVVKGCEGTLSVYSETSFSNYLNKLSALPNESKNVRDVLRVALSSVVELNIDSKSRVQIPAPIIDEYHLEKEVVVIGLIDHLEIWNRTKWDEYKALNEQKFEQKLEDLIGL